MSRAREFADLAGSADAGGLTGRNLIINGAMQVAQRGTSETGVTGGGYHNAPDRWRVDGALGTWTVSQSTDTPEGFSNSYKLECTTAGATPAADDFRVFQQYIEAQNLQHLKYGTSNAQALTLSFWVKSNKTGTYTGYFYQDDATRLYSFSYSIDSADTWEYKTITVAGDTSGQIDNNTAKGLRATFLLAAGSNRATGSVTNAWGAYVKADEGTSNMVNLADTVGNEWYITGVQLEVGEKATPFEHRSFGDELARCQRYYEKSYDHGTAPGTTNTGGGVDHRYVARSTPNNYGFYTRKFATPKRAAPTVTVYGYVGTANKVSNGDTGSDLATVDTIQLSETGFLPRNTSGSSVSAQAIMFHFVADAEL